jgi:DNA polymerase (family 10)
LAHLELGIANARKGWLTQANVLNTRSAAEVLAFARARRVDAGATSPHRRVMQG